MVAVQYKNELMVTCACLKNRVAPAFSIVNGMIKTFNMQE